MTSEEAPLLTHAESAGGKLQTRQGLCNTLKPCLMYKSGRNLQQKFWWNVIQRNWNLLRYWPVRVALNLQNLQGSCERVKIKAQLHWTSQNCVPETTTAWNQCRGTMRTSSASKIIVKWVKYLKVFQFWRHKKRTGSLEQICKYERYVKIWYIMCSVYYIHIIHICIIDSIDLYFYICYTNIYVLLYTPWIKFYMKKWRPRDSWMQHRSESATLCGETLGVA